jgi:hypothetical protein
MNRNTTKEIADIMNPTDVLKIRIEGDLWKEFYLEGKPCATNIYTKIETYIDNVNYLMYPDPTGDLPEENRTYLCICKDIIKVLFLRAFFESKTDVKRTIIMGKTTLFIEFDSSESMLRYFPSGISQGRDNYK